MSTATYDEAAFQRVFDKGLTELSTNAQKGLLAAYEAWRSDLLDTERFIATVASVLGVSNAYARAWGDFVATAALRGLRGLDVQPVGEAVGIDADAEATRLVTAATTLSAALDTDGDLTDRLVRIATSETANAVQQTAITTYSHHGVTGYVRGLNAGACELCVWLYKDGYVYPTSKPMHRHTGCGCRPIPVDN